MYFLALFFLQISKRVRTRKRNRERERERERETDRQTDRQHKHTMTIYIYIYKYIYSCTTGDVGTSICFFKRNEGTLIFFWEPKKFP